MKSELSVISLPHGFGLLLLILEAEFSLYHGRRYFIEKTFAGSAGPYSVPAHRSFITTSVRDLPRTARPTLPKHRRHRVM